MGMHEDGYSRGALDHHFKVFGDSIEFKPVGGSWSTVDGQVEDLPDGTIFVGHQVRVRSAQVTDPQPGDFVRLGGVSGTTLRVRGTSRDHGGEFLLACEYHQIRG